MAMGSPASPRNVGAVQPPRAARLLHTRRTLSKPASSSYRRFLVLRSFTTLVAASSPRYHFVCLSRGGPSRRARCLTRVRSSRPRACIYRSHARSFLSLSYAAHSRDACRALHPPCRAHLGCHSLATTESAGLQGVFSRGPRRTALAKTNTRGFPGPRRRRYPPPVCSVSLGSRRQTSLPPPRAYFARSSTYGA